MRRSGYLPIVVGSFALLVAACASAGFTATPDGAPARRGNTAYACDADGRMFVWGGNLPPQRTVRHLFNDGAVLSENGWSIVARAPLSERTSAGAVAVGDAVLVWGRAGAIVASNNPDDFDIKSDGVLYSMIDNQWSTVPPSVLNGRADPLMVAAGNRVYVHGGSRPGQQHILMNAAIFDIETYEWQTSRTPPERAVVASDGTSFLAFNADGVYLLDSGANEWVGVQTSDSHGLEEPSHAFSAIGAVLVFDSGVLLRFDPESPGFSVLGPAPISVPSGAAFSGESVTVWSESESLVAHGSEGEWIMHELQGAMAPRTGTASCVTANSAVIWGGFWHNSDGFETPTDTDVRFDFQDS